jgi:AcrR family transcriptional regulator
VGRKVGLDLNTITDAAIAIVESDGLEAATLSSVAASLGIKVPSLYNHVSGLAGLRRLIALEAAARLTEHYRASQAPLPPEATSSERLRAVAGAHRRFALDHPGLYRSLLPAPRPGEDDELHDAMAQPVRLVAAVMSGHDELDPARPDSTTINRLRALRSLIHGFVDLELNGGFGLPVDIDKSFEAAVDQMVGAGWTTGR